MKIIKNLTVNVTYRVELDNVEVPDDVYDSLANCYDWGGVVPNPSESDEDSGFLTISEKLMQWIGNMILKILNNNSIIRNEVI